VLHTKHYISNIHIFAFFVNCLTFLKVRLGITHQTSETIINAEGVATWQHRMSRRLSQSSNRADGKFFVDHQWIVKKL
jgi:hypothetical protein